MSQQPDTRARIVRTAAKLFLTRSYQTVGVSELCAAADVRKGSFYHYFPSKAALARAVIDYQAGALEAALAERMDGSSPAGQLHALAEAIGSIQSRFETHFGRVVGCPFGNLAAEVATTDDEVRQHLAGVFARWEALLARACRQAAEAGVLRTHPERLAHAMLAQAQGAILLAKTAGTPAADVPATLHELVNLSLTEHAVQHGTDSPQSSNERSAQ